MNYIIKSTVALFLILGINYSSVFAQAEYRTSTGLVIIKIFLDNKPVLIESRELFMLLDYETGKVILKQEISALTSEHDSIQSLLNSMSDEQFKFEGKFDLDYINTTGHPPLDFLVEGAVFPGNRHIIGAGHLVHRVQGTSSACLLNLSFSLNLDEVFPDHKLSGLNNEIYIEVRQSLLARTND